MATIVVFRNPFPPSIETTRYNVSLMERRLNDAGRYLSSDVKKDIMCRTIWARSLKEWVDLACDAIDEASAPRLPWKGGRDVRELTRKHG